MEEIKNASIQKRLAGIYGFSSVEVTPQARQEGVDWQAVEAGLEAHAQILRHASGIDAATARQLCGMGGQIQLLACSPSELMDGTGASFNPSKQRIKVLGSAGRAMQGFCHEWTHSLDWRLGSEVPLAHSGLFSHSDGDFKSRMIQAANGKAPYQEMLGAAIEQISRSFNASMRYASVPASKGLHAEKLPSFSALARAMGPFHAAKASKSEAAKLARQAAGQKQTMLEMAEQAALICIRQDEALSQIGEERQKALAAFCAKAIGRRGKQESLRRRGREVALDSAKKDIATLIERGLGLDPQQAALSAASIMHIVPAKASYGDDLYFSSPYTGDSSWAVPASLADLSCALVRAERNQRAIENSALAKERHVPMAFWWSMRRFASEAAQRAKTIADMQLEAYSEQNLLDSSLRAHADQWAQERQAYCAGALIFSDLTKTGSKMLAAEAEMAGESLDDAQSKALRARIAAPVNDMARAQAIFESLAESFEQFIQLNSRFKTPLGKACRKAMDLGILDNDPELVEAALDPKRAWMHDKPSDPGLSAKLWRKALKEALPLVAANSAEDKPRGSKP